MWLLIAAAAGIVSAISSGFADYASEKDTKTGRSVKIAIPALACLFSSLIAVIAGIVGLVRFIKWIWIG